MTDADMFRYCIYCGCDCYEDNPAHRDDCPQTTGVYPITKSDIENQVVCAECRSLFAVGDSYCLQAIEGSDDVFSTVCVGCGILHPVSAIDEWDDAA